MTETIHLAILQTYIQPLEALIERKARYYLALSERDVFGMPDEAARTHQRRLADLAAEIEVLDNVSKSIGDIQAVYHEKLHAAEKTIAMAAHDYISLMKDHLILSEMYTSSDEYAQYLSNHIISRRHS